MVGQTNGPTVLNVAEKPSVARALAGVFSRMPRAREGAAMRRDPHQIFTHENVCFPLVFSQGQRQQQRGGQNVPHKMITTSVRGHLASIDFGPEYGWNRCDPISLFDANLETSYRDDMKPLHTMLTRLARNAQAVILWLDCDREGEAIGDEVQTVCLEANRRLETKIYRARFSTVMDGEIRRALNSLDRLNDWLVQAVQARSQIDLRVGAAFTRFQSLRLQKKFQLKSGGGGNSSVISYGPCQFPTLGFVVERWARIETFAPEDFWFLELTLRIPTNNDDNDNNFDSIDRPNQGGNNNNNANRPISFTWKRQRLFDRTFTLNLYESCLDDGTAVVTNLSGREKRKWRPVPLATVELQKRASRYLRIGSEALMTAAEALYNEGYISYPRTETERFRPEFQHRPLIQDLAGVGGAFGEYANKLLNGGFQNPRAGQHDDQAHPPITPCKAVDPNTIPDPTQRGVYTLVVKHYLACCSTDALGKETSISVKIASEEFTAKGLMILEKNWLEIYEPWERWSTGQGLLPPVMVGSRVVPDSLLMKEGTTAPPQPLSEVELISLMDRNGIGTDATIAQHISTIQDRNYATKDANQRFLPSPLGIALVEGYNSMGYQLNKPALRREMEHECNLVANQQKTKDDIIGPILNKMRECYERVQEEARKLDDAMARHFQPLGAGNETITVQATFSTCGTCQNSMSLKQERGGNNARGQRKLLYCSGCQQGYALPRGQVRPKTEEENGGPAVKCPICNFQVIKVSRGDGYEGNGYHVCPKCFSDPPPDHGGAQNGGNFRCFDCINAACSLAGGTPGGDIEIFACPFCKEHGNRNGKVCMRKTTRGYVLSCSNYSSQSRCSYSIWLPRESLTVSIPPGDENLCRQCSTSRRSAVRKVSFVWKRNSVPPHLGEGCTVCVLCDSTFRQDLQVTLPRMDQVRTNGRGNNRTGTGGGGRATNRAQAAPYPPVNSNRNYNNSNNNRQSYNNNSNRNNNRRNYNNNGSNSSSYNNNNRRNYNNNGNNQGASNNTITCYKCGQAGHYANACTNNR